MIDHDDIRTLREYLHMTQQDMASALSISVRYYRMMESGEREMSIKVAQNLYKYLIGHHLILVCISEIIDCLSRID